MGKLIGGMIAAVLFLASAGTILSFVFFPEHVPADMSTDVPTLIGVCFFATVLSSRVLLEALKCD